MSENIENPVTAVTRADPYPYYRRLVADTPLYFDPELKMWIVSGAEAAAAVLRNENCKVRPAGEPVPKALAGSAAGDIFGRLVRMNDGEKHRTAKPVVRESLELFSPDKVTELAKTLSRQLIKEFRPQEDRAGLNEFMFSLPVFTVSGLLDIAEDEMRNVVKITYDLVAGFSPLADDRQISDCISAAERSQGIFRGNKSSEFVEVMQKRDIKEETAKANAIGFLTQTYDATAGLIGNTLIALTKYRDFRIQVKTDPILLSTFIDEVIRYDPPVQNTRRFVHVDTEISGVKVNAGDSILIVIAAANHDMVLNPEPAIFEINRKNRRYLTFGLGAHECPGRRLAHNIALAGAGELIRSGLDLETLADGITYRRSVNARIPVFKELRNKKNDSSHFRS